MHYTKKDVVRIAVLVARLWARWP